MATCEAPAVSKPVGPRNDIARGERLGWIVVVVVWGVGPLKPRLARRVWPDFFQPAQPPTHTSAT